MSNLKPPLAVPAGVNQQHKIKVWNLLPSCSVVARSKTEFRQGLDKFTEEMSFDFKLLLGLGAYFGSTSF